MAHFVKKNNNKSHIQHNFVYVANCLNYCPKLRSAAIDGLITIHTHTHTQRHTFDTTHAFGHCHGQVQMWPDQYDVILAVVIADDAHEVSKYKLDGYTAHSQLASGLRGEI